jgi:hypothetical protein
VPLIFVGALPGTRAVLPPALELQADSLAVGAVARAGYDPEALVRYLSREQPRDGVLRIDRMQQAIDALPVRQYAAGGHSTFARFQDEVRALVPGLGTICGRGLR